jgi:hypothetical protein
MHIGSIILGVLSLALFTTTFVIVANDPSPEATDLQIAAILASVAVALAGLTLGIITRRKETMRDVATVGIALNGSTIATFLLAIALGMVIS